MARIEHPHVREHWRLALIQGLQDRGWNQQELRAHLKAAGVVISQTTVSNWMTMGVIPDAYAGLRTCQLLGIELEWALTRRKARAVGDAEAVRAGMLEAAGRMAEVLDQLRAEVTGGAAGGGRGLAAHLASERGAGKKRAQPDGAVRRAGPR
jgi:hypothetical protein